MRGEGDTLLPLGSACPSSPPSASRPAGEGGCADSPLPSGLALSQHLPSSSFPSSLRRPLAGPATRRAHSGAAAPGAAPRPRCGSSSRGSQGCPEPPGELCPAESCGQEAPGSAGGCARGQRGIHGRMRSRKRAVREVRERTRRSSITLDAAASGGESPSQGPHLAAAHQAHAAAERLAAGGALRRSGLALLPSQAPAQAQPQASTIMSGMSVLTMLLSRS